MEASSVERMTCPACGGAGGGPFGPAGSAWDDEDYVCPRCEGEGMIALDDVMVQSQRPGIVKAEPEKVEKTKRKASA
ncbi:MAG: hypothetical protein KF819_04870 [Labilithrix sp.]|nr:hypothetical protein [Labilithrix sp.]